MAIRNRLLFYSCLALCLVLLVGIRQHLTIEEAPQKTALIQIADFKNPIPIHDSVWLEDLTWLEIRDLINSGAKNVIVPTGGIEQNGPFVVTGKHNYVVRQYAEQIARLLGNTLVAPVVKFVPQGGHNPPTGHMQYSGTIGLTNKTFESLLKDICVSLKIHGFENIFLIGDSGGSQDSQKTVAQHLSEKWEALDINVVNLTSYYEYDKWGYTQLKNLGIYQEPDIRSAQRSTVHSDYYYESILATVDPELIRSSERIKIGEMKINGVELLPIEGTVEVGNSLIRARAEMVVDEIKKAYFK